ncbi:hypothetical protein F66182_12056 [Fusarium sp. NRRL 66182]|nr:hypothetical protein F66182_12056 [Fusarium sp. NRRL 66182]
MADQDDDYFNDLSRQSMSQDATQSHSGNTGGNTSPTEDDGNPVPRPKRMACIVLRKKSGPKRGYVKQLEARLAQVEILLKNQEPENSWNETSRNTLPNTSMPPTASNPLSGMP